MIQIEEQRILLYPAGNFSFSTVTTQISRVVELNF